jgi:hypothetical protein
MAELRKSLRVIVSIEGGFYKRNVHGGKAVLYILFPFVRRAEAPPCLTRAPCVPRGAWISF